MSWIKTHKIWSTLIFCVFLVVSVIVTNSFIASWFLHSWLKEQASDVELQDLTFSFRNSVNGDVADRFWKFTGKAN